MQNLLIAGVSASLILGGSSTAWAAPIVLTFEGLGDQTPIGDYYNGGGGPNYGISFGADSLSIISNQDGGSGNFSNAPSGDTVAFFLSGPGDVLNKSSGFDTGFSFYYADQVGYTGSVSVYSGLDGTGTLLASLDLASTPDPYNVFLPIGVAFSGTAESVVFSGSANYIAFDNITLGSSTAMSTVPLPASAPMFGAALLALAGFGYGMNRWVAPKGKAAAVA